MKSADKVSFQRQRPYALFIVCAIQIAFVLLSLVFLKRFQISFLPAYISLLSSLLLLIQNKRTWTLGATTLVLAILLSFRSVLGFVPMQDYEQGAHILLIALNMSVLLTMGFFFKAPYLSERDSIMGFGERKKIALNGLMTVSNKEYPILIMDISSSGLGIKIEPGLPSLTEDNEVVLKIPEIQNFQSRVKVRRINSDYLAARFQGWSWGSLQQHSKLLTYLLFNYSKPMTKPVNSEKGFTLVEALVVCAISSIVVFAVSNAFIDVEKISKRSLLSYQLEAIKQDFTWAIKDTPSWNRTVSNPANAALACLSNQSDCTALAAGPTVFNIYNSGDVLILDSMNATSGFDWNGVACNTFDAVNGNDLCPLHFQASLTIKCSVNCVNPSVDVTITTSFNPRNKEIVLNSQRNTINISKNPAIESLQANCDSLQGTLDPVSKICMLTIYTSGCKKTGQYLTGLNNGKPVCAAIPVGTMCPPGQWIQSFDPTTGAANCVVY